MKKKILVAAAALAVAAAVVLVIVIARLDSIVKVGVEKVGPQVTQTPVTLAKVHVGLLSGSGSVEGFVLGNPEGYKSEFAIKVGTASLSLDAGSLLTDKIHIKQVLVVAPEITLEGALGGKNNLTKIMDNVQAAAGPAPAKDGTPAPAQDKKAAGKKIQVDEFILRGAKLHLSLSVGPLGNAKTTVPLPDIILKDLGKDSDGLTGAELTRKVLQEIVSSSLKAAQDAVAGAGKLGGEGVNALKSGLKGLLGK